MEHWNGSLEASYDGVKLELQATESHIKQLQARADKLRAAIVSFQELIPVCQPAPTSGDVWLKHDSGL